jgi:hypothetical protein
LSNSQSKPGSAKVELWTAPDVGKGAAAPGATAPGAAAYGAAAYGASAPRPMATVSGLADLQAEAYREAFAQGLDEGREAGRAEVAAQVERLQGMFYDLAKPFKELDEEVERELLTLAMALARQIVRRELKADPTHIIGIIREAMTKLPWRRAMCACICTRRMPPWCARISRPPRASAPGRSSRIR